MYFIYILQNSLKRYYIGHTDSLSRRIEEHNKGLSKYTRERGPWKLVYWEEYSNRSEAIKREVEIKRKKSRKYIEKLVDCMGERPDIPKG